MNARTVVIIAGLATLGCAGVPGVTCPSQIQAGESCVRDGQRCMIAGHEDDCGLNGHICRDGTWREAMTYCNPPPPNPVEPP